MKRAAAIAAIAMAFAIPSTAWCQAPVVADRSADHTALRALMAKGVEALNTRKFEALAPNVDAGLTVITVDSRKHVGLDAFRTYFTGLFEGPNAMLANFKTEVVVDAETTFVDANTGVAYGTSKDTFTFRDGDVRTMATRWSAVTRKDGDVWKLVNVHFSTNVLDNPVLEGAKAMAWKIAVGAAIAALLVGLVIGLAMRRRPRA